MNRLAFAALWALVFLIPWDNTIELPGAGSLAQVVGVGAFGLSVFGMLVSGNVRRPNAVLLLAVGFLAWSVLTLLWTLSLDLTLVRTVTYTQVVTLLWMIWQQARKESQQHALLSAYVLGAYVPAFDTIAHYLTGVSINPNEMRYSATGFNANEVAIILVLGIPIAWYLALSTKSRLHALVNVCYVPLALVAALLTGSRGAFVAVPVSLLLVPWSFRRLSARARVGLVALVVASICIVSVMVPSASWKRLSETSSQVSDGDFSMRGLIWKDALQVFLNYPVTGVGAGAFERVTQPIRGRRLPTHQTFLSVLSGQGLIGLSLFLGMFVAAFSAIPRMRGLQRKFWIVLAATLVIGLIPRDWDFRKTTWFLLGVLTAQAALARRNDSPTVESEEAVSKLKPVPDISHYEGPGARRAAAPAHTTLDTSLQYRPTPAVNSTTRITYP